MSDLIHLLNPATEPFSGYDTLEPSEQGLVIATSRPNTSLRKEQPEGKLFLWVVGKPRRVYSQESPLWGLVAHNGRLLSTTIPTDGERIDQCIRGSFIKDLVTGEVFYHTKGVGKYCSHEGDLYFFREDYHSEKVITWNSQIGERTDSVLCRMDKKNRPEELMTLQAKVESMISTPSGLVVSAMADPRGDGPNRILNLMTGEVYHSRQLWVNGKPVEMIGGYDLGQVLALSYDGERVYYPISYAPSGVYDQNGNSIAYFPMIDWLERRVVEIVRGLPESRWSEEMDEVENRARVVLGYSYEKAMSSECNHFRTNIWKNSKQRRDDPNCLYRRVALSQYIDHNFVIRNMTFHNGNLVMASDRNLYVVPLSEETCFPIPVNPFRHRVWRFRDNICGMDIIVGEELKKLKGNASIRMGKNASFVSLAQAA
ncbi:hypothetical protein J4426_00610 [Candidatus Woesearchaeota archaeon]|nr:hypothetical protein [Candidatus Woesearchaeota archaeon]